MMCGITASHSSHLTASSHLISLISSSPRVHQSTIYDIQFPFPLSLTIGFNFQQTLHPVGKKKNGIVWSYPLPFSARCSKKKTQKHTFVQYMTDKENPDQPSPNSLAMACAYFRRLTLMQLLHPQGTLVDAPVDCCSDSQRAADDGAHSSQESSEALGTDFTVDDFHWGDVLSRH